jgi:hypothetical protein
LNKVVATFEKHIFLSQTDLTRTGIISNSYNDHGYKYQGVRSRSNKAPPPTHTHTFLGNNLEKLNFKHGIQNQKNQQIKRKYGMIEAKMIFFLLSLLKA